MTTEQIVAARAEGARHKVAEVIEAHGLEERLENIQACGHVTPRYPVHLASAHAEMLAGLAKIVEEQNTLIEELEKATAAEKKTPAKKTKPPERG